MEKATARDIYDLFAELAELANIDLSSPEFARPHQKQEAKPENASNIFAIPSEKNRKDSEQMELEPWKKIASEWKLQLAEVKTELSEQMLQIHSSLLEKLQLIQLKLDEHPSLHPGPELSNLHVTNNTLEINDQQPLNGLHQQRQQVQQLNQVLTSSISELKRLESLQLQVEEMDADTRKDDLAQMEAFIADELRKIRTAKALQ